MGASEEKKRQMRFDTLDYIKHLEFKILIFKLRLSELKITTGLGMFLYHIENFRTAFIENFGSILIMNVLLIPTFFLFSVVVCILDCFVEIVKNIIDLAVTMAMVGAYIVLMYTGYKAYSVYIIKFDMYGNRIGEDID